LIGYALTAWSPAYFARSFGLTATQTALILGPLVAVVGTISGLAGGRYADRLGRTVGLHAQSWMVGGLKVLAFPFVLGIYLSGDLRLAIVCLGFAYLFQSSYLGPTFALIQGLAPIKLRSMWAAVTLLVINLVGLGIGPTAIGMLSDLYRPTMGEESLRYALLTGAAATPWAIWHYWRAGVHLKRLSVAKSANLPLT
jgi:nitrate/nitrite transporter NarK